MHVRTTLSVGRLTPEEVVKSAGEKGLAAIAIVEHDTVEAIPEAVAVSKLFDVELIPSVELVYEEGMRNAHIIGYFIDWHKRRLRSEIARAQVMRANRITSTLERLRELGIQLSYEDVLREAGDSRIIARTHIAAQLVRMRMVKNMREAFERYFEPGKPAHVPTEQRPLHVLVDLIHEAGGVAALAHPKFGQAEKFIPRLVREGLRGIEVYHPAHTPAERRRFRKIARKYKLIRVGGTDSGAGSVGDMTVSYRVVEQLRKSIRR